AERTAPGRRHGWNAAHDGAVFHDDASVRGSQGPGVADVEIAHGAGQLNLIGRLCIGGEVETGAPDRTGIRREAVAAGVLHTLLNPVPVNVEDAGIEAQAAVEHLVL